MHSTGRFEKTRVGISGIDDVLCGGLAGNCLFLFGGRPGTGKTTLGLQFPLDGARRRQKGLTLLYRKPRKN
jgi:circadian clock protein KaiC